MIVLFASNKGGVGKTTTAVNMAAFLASKCGSVCILKADKNDDLFHYQESREETGKPMIFSIIDLQGDLKKQVVGLSKSFDVVIIDCAGHDSIEFRDALQVANVYLSLVKPSSNFETSNLINLTRTVRRAEKFNPELRSFVVLARVNYRYLQDAKTLRDILVSDPNWLQPASINISEMAVYEKACNKGLSVHELTSGYNLAEAKGQIEKLCLSVGITKE